VCHVEIKGRKQDEGYSLRLLFHANILKRPSTTDIDKVGITDKPNRSRLSVAWRRHVSRCPLRDHRMHLENAAIPIATMPIRQSFRISFTSRALDPRSHPIVFSGSSLHFRGLWM